MNENLQRKIEIPSYETVSAVYHEQKKRKSLWAAFLSVFIVLWSAFAVAAVLALLFFPIEKIYGDNISPKLDNDDIVFLMRQPTYSRGDLVCLDVGDFSLCKRIVGVPGDYIDFKDSNELYVNDQYVDEWYLIDNNPGEYENTYPYQVPDNCYFVLSDKRSVMTDSRSAFIGAVKDTTIIGRVLFRIWPFDKFEYIR